uniref:HMA domain-containing protein n=1 Tax=Oryza punctata TaxID=4537 RepID=A0A0E0KRP4_ORYPU
MPLKSLESGSHGVQSVTVAGEERNLLLVIGDGVVDASRLTRRLRNHVGYAEIVELTTSSSGRSSAVPPVDAVAAVTEDGAARPRYHGLGGGGLPWFARVGCPVTAHSVVASHAAPEALWPGAGEVGGSWAAPADVHSPRQQAPSYSAHPSPCYRSSPLAVAAVPVRSGGGGYALDVARSHPANYSPMIERHDGRRHYPKHSCYSRGKVPSCCTIQ